ncbi:MAG: FAD-binding protein [Akkermansiaceae bacterium]|nr:FAD-binding protein [Akkermansiaceae bacterium]
MGLQPVSAEETVEAVRSYSCLRIAGARSKPRLSEGEGDLLEMTSLTGITEYEASEYTFTARAGTSLEEVTEVLAKKGQYLPFDPMFVRSGATLGGAVGSGISGAGRFRFGGLRDFLIGVQFVDGRGRIRRGGGKVVKNAAGFDFPKLMVGSLGRFGVLTEVTFKVFPAPVARRTVRIRCDQAEGAVERMAAIATSRWEAEALGWNANAGTIHVRLGGPPVAVEALAGEIAARWPEGAEQLSDEEALSYWEGMGEQLWRGEDEVVVKVPLSPSRIPAFERGLPSPGQAKRVYDSGGSVGWIAVGRDAVEDLDRALRELNLRGLVVQGEKGKPLWLGRDEDSAVVAAVKEVFDPEDRFLEL